ncbi:MAG: YciI family protein [Acidimicrobiales bacterium]
MAVVSGGQLRASRDATTVRTRDDKVVLADGPFVVTNEQIGGFALIEVRPVLK